MTFYFVRHTEFSNPENVYAFRLPLELSQEGIEHAKRIGEWFSSISVSGLPVFSSPIKRTLQTAEIIAETIHSEISSDDRLIESFCPNLQGKKQPPGETWKIQCEDESRETTLQVLKRMQSFFQDKVKEGNDCIVVSHGDPLTALYYSFIDKPLTKCLHDENDMGSYVQKGEVVKVIIVDGNFKTEKYAP